MNEITFNIRVNMTSNIDDVITKIKKVQKEFVSAEVKFNVDMEAF